MDSNNNNNTAGYEETLIVFAKKASLPKNIINDMERALDRLIYQYNDIRHFYPGFKKYSDLGYDFAMVFWINHTGPVSRNDVAAYMTSRGISPDSYIVADDIMLNTATDKYIEPRELHNVPIPRGTTNYITANNINEGDEMVNFGNESKYGRYYKKSTYNSLRSKVNPVTRMPIRPEDVEYYRAHITGGSKRRRNRRATKTRRRRRGSPATKKQKK